MARAQNSRTEARTQGRSRARSSKRPEQQPERQPERQREPRSAGVPKKTALIGVIIIAVVAIAALRGHKAELSYGGASLKIDFDAQTLTPAERQARSRDLQQKVETEVQAAPLGSEAQPTEQPQAPRFDLRGAWTNRDESVVWYISFERGYYIVREKRFDNPDVFNAEGYGTFDGRTLSIELEYLAGGRAAATLDVRDDGTLHGAVAARRGEYTLVLQRTAESPQAGVQ